MSLYSSSSSLPSDFKGSVEEFQGIIRRIREQCEEIETSSKAIDDTEFSDLSIKFSSLLEDLEALSAKVGSATGMMEAISTAFRRHL